MKQIEIKNLRIARIQYPWDIKVDRTSVLGNPYYMAHEGMRDEVCDKYYHYFYNKIKNNDIEFINELSRLITIYKDYGSLNLFCWCYPKRCHAEVIKDYIESVCNTEGGDDRG